MGFDFKPTQVTDSLSYLAKVGGLFLYKAAQYSDFYGGKRVFQSGLLFDFAPVHPAGENQNGTTRNFFQAAGRWRLNTFGMPSMNRLPGNCRYLAFCPLSAALKPVAVIVGRYTQQIDEGAPQEGVVAALVVIAHEKCRPNRPRSP